jgi:CcmD family protein
MNKKILLTILAVVMLAIQANAETEMADTMRSNGKIYVVIAVLATIFAGIFAYIVYLDRKIAKIEKTTK